MELARAARRHPGDGEEELHLGHGGAAPDPRRRRTDPRRRSSRSTAAALLHGRVLLQRQACPPPTRCPTSRRSTPSRRGFRPELAARPRRPRPRPCRPTRRRSTPPQILGRDGEEDARSPSASTRRASFRRQAGPATTCRLEIGQSGMGEREGARRNGRPRGGAAVFGGDDGRFAGGENSSKSPIIWDKGLDGGSAGVGLSLPNLPADMVQAAKTLGIQKLLLLRYLDVQASVWPLGPAIRSFSLLRNRMLVDPAFLFKIGTEIVINTCCATFAEVQKRGEEFWSEFELYAADMLVGVVVNVALVSMLAPYARFGGSSASGLLGRVRHAYDALPSSVFEAERPGYSFSVQQRIGTYFFKGILYCSVGFFCGLVGQGIANLIMTAKRNVKKSEHDVPVPPLLKTSALWGVFLGVSSNTRYQIINGLERLVEASPIAKRVPAASLAFTVGVRFANNVYGGMQFVDWARMTGCQ